jgi:hypothetical protein
MKKMSKIFRNSENARANEEKHQHKQEENIDRSVRYQVLTAASMKTTVCCDVAPCSLIEVYHRRLRGACCLHHQDLMIIALIMEARSTSDTSVNFYQTTRRYTPEDGHLQGLNFFLAQRTLLLIPGQGSYNSHLSLAHLKQFTWTD